MHRDQRRVQLGDNDYAAEYRLRDNRGGLRGSKPEQVTAALAVFAAELPGGHADADCDHEDRDSDEPVAELHPAMDQRVTGRPSGGDTVRGAVRPVRAAEPGLTEPDGGSGQDDECRRDKPC